MDQEIYLLIKSRNEKGIELLINEYAAYFYRFHRDDEHGKSDDLKGKVYTNALRSN